jgi:hypothetical protein
MQGSEGEQVHVRVKDIFTEKVVYVAMGPWDTIGVLKKRLEGKGMGGFDMQVRTAAGLVCWRCLPAMLLL